MPPRLQQPPPHQVTAQRRSTECLSRAAEDPCPPWRTRHCAGADFGLVQCVASLSLIFHANLTFCRTPPYLWRTVSGDAAAAAIAALASLFFVSLLLRHLLGVALIIGTARLPLPFLLFAAPSASTAATVLAALARPGFLDPRLDLLLVVRADLVPVVHQRRGEQALVADQLPHSATAAYAHQSAGSAPSYRCGGRPSRSSALSCGTSTAPTLRTGS